ncbi:MAG: sensor histidine kinase [Aureliella sp.]
MFSQIQLFLLGVATVIDTVLLLIVLERVNRRQIADWLYALLAGLWLVHATSFLHEVLRDVPNSDWAHRLDIALTCAGLMLLPSAMLHAAVWLNFGRVEHNRFYWLFYAPLLGLPWIAREIWQADTPTFMAGVQSMAQWYLVWVALVNGVAIVLFLRAGKRLRVAGAAEFFPRLALLLALMTFVVIGYYQVIGYDRIEAAWRLLLILTPLLPALLFVWYSLNQRMLPLVMERTLVYGAFLVSLLLLHRLLIEPLASSLQARAKVDIVLVEGWMLVGLVLLWPPLRTRFREAVRYLLSTNVHQIRDATRRLSVEMSQLSWQSIDQFVDWMSEALKSGIEVDFVHIWLSDQSRSALQGASTLTSASPKEASSDHDEAAMQRQADLALIESVLQNQDEPLLDRGQGLASDVEAAMLRLGAMWAFRLHFRTIAGVVLIGPRRRSDRLAEEQLTALSLLLEQFAATLHNRQSELLRMRIERHAMQQDKLSALGLIAGSLAHELRNPLSSVRTIATLMLEDLGPQHEHAGDVAMIIGEIDRLTQTTQRLLDYSRPQNDGVSPNTGSQPAPSHVEPDLVIARLLHILGHLARQCHVSIETSLTASGKSVSASDATLSEILFNLIKNAIEAACAAPQGLVTIETSCSGQSLQIAVRDNGPGIDPDMQATMFEPFVTGKAGGTGLGLYIVNERVKELGGTIACTSTPEQGTAFLVSLPMSSHCVPSASSASLR